MPGGLLTHAATRRTWPCRCIVARPSRLPSSGVRCQVSSKPLLTAVSKLADLWKPAASGYAALLGVAILWGSFTPALRYLFLSDEPPSAAMMNALQACLPVPFLAASGMAAHLARKKPRPVTMSSLNSISLSSYDEIYEPALTMGSTQSDGNTIPSPALRPPQNAFERVCARALNWRSTSLAVAGAELGLWLFLEFSLEVLGVQLISATKAAYLNQATVLITPLLVYLSGENVISIEWLACSIALAGSILVAVDGMQFTPPDAAAAASAVTQSGLMDMGADGAVADAVLQAQASVPAEDPLGLAFVLGSSLFFGLSTLRMGRYSSRFSALDLSSAATLGLAVLSLGWVAASIYGSPNGLSDSVTMLQHLCSDPTRLAVLVWVGAGPGALAAFLQAAGQQQVPPAQAQVIYATTPIFATGIAMVFLNSADEIMGPMAWVGAALMLGASVLASVGVTQHEAA